MSEKKPTKTTQHPGTTLKIAATVKDATGKTTTNIQLELTLPTDVSTKLGTLLGTLLNPLIAAQQGWRDFQEGN